ncbi:hypothetical protein FFLO_02648 [Filobasidium floriforme]|uniref:Uncharacterized protein n=1 Tax=Filobasidium floriforme TaxID=5210 RepID=A0A8K0NRL1_9TREE|nr:uncharacterized protein HD553DRAFT_321544 [Filobasidium floriforme]KAG7561919.1 hypothetical protein FFLO_02648 [Filobasidium floriforme]KAH8089400.1 hypothetical protein HD553DRAFT_321544 [Filobasidium floriforme]
MRLCVCAGHTTEDPFDLSGSADDSALLSKNIGIVELLYERAGYMVVVDAVLKGVLATSSLLSKRDWGLRLLRSKGLYGRAGSTNQYTKMRGDVVSGIYDATRLLARTDAVSCGLWLINRPISVRLVLFEKPPIRPTRGDDYGGYHLTTLGSPKLASPVVLSSVILSQRESDRGWMEGVEMGWMTDDVMGDLAGYPETHSVAVPVWPV